jgi:hypothetical protein
MQTGNAMREADSHGGSRPAAAIPRQAPWRRPGLRPIPWLTLGINVAGCGLTAAAPARVPVVW